MPGLCNDVCRSVVRAVNESLTTGGLDSMDILLKVVSFGGKCLIDGLRQRMKSCQRA